METLLGIPGATGVAMGRVRMPSTAARAVRTGDVLVIDEWDAGVEAVLPRAAGLVLDAGRTQTDALAAARRFHVPALMIAGARSRLGEGDLVEVDGYAGEVRVLANHEARMVA